MEFVAAESFDAEESHGAEWQQKSQTARMHQFDKDDTPLEPFNMNEERRIGAFDEHGHYVWKRNPGSDDTGKMDPWLDAVDGGDTFAVFDVSIFSAHISVLTIFSPGSRLTGHRFVASPVTSDYI